MLESFLSTMLLQNGFQVYWIRRLRSPDASSTALTHVAASTHSCPRAAAVHTAAAVVDPVPEFAKDNIRLIKRCDKPDRKSSSRSPRGLPSASSLWDWSASLSSSSSSPSTTSSLAPSGPFHSVQFNFQSLSHHNHKCHKPSIVYLIVTEFEASLF